MIFELPQEGFPKAGHLLGDLGHYLVLTTLLEGRTPGRIWANDADEPTIALIWDRLNGFFFLAGDSSDGDLNQELNGLIVNTIFPQAIRLGYRHLFFQFTPSRWDAQVEVILRGAKPAKCFVHGYQLDAGRSTIGVNSATTPPAGYRLTRITEGLLSKTDVENLAEIASCIRACWGSTDRYVKDGGIGYCLVKGEAIASWCSTDYLTGNACELYVETFEGYKRRGLGTLTAAACVQACVAQGLTVYWHCFEDNLGSVRIAEKLGSGKTVECPVYVVEARS